MCVMGIDFASFYSVLIRFFDCSDNVILFVFCFSDVLDVRQQPVLVFWRFSLSVIN